MIFVVNVSEKRDCDKIFALLKKKRMLSFGDFLSPKKNWH
jgi:hypothetical protein